MSATPAPLRIGPLVFDIPVALSPMAGFTDAALRLLCREQGAAFAMTEVVTAEGLVRGSRLSREMLELAAARGGPLHLCYLQGDMHALPLIAGSCELVTGSYALRNAPDLDCALAEISRVLRPGGHAAFLDFSKAVTPRGQHWQYSLLRLWCGLWGRLLSGSWEVHGYIAESLRRFPAGEELVRLMRLHDLELLIQKRFFCGMMQLLQLRRAK